MSVLLVLATLFVDVEYTSGLFVLYALFLFMYHYTATNTFNGVFLLYLLTMMVSEVGFLYDFEKYINPLSIVYIIGQLCFIWLLRPMLRVNFKNFSTHNLTELIIGFIGVSYIIGYILYLIFPLIPDLTLFVPSVIAFIIIVALCIGVPFFNKHPDNIMLWGLGGALIAEMSSAFIYEYVSDHRSFIVMAHIFGAFLKILFATYIVRMKDIKETESDYN